LENTLVPKHEVLAPEEAEKLLETYNVTHELLPKIKLSDPAIKGLNAKVGDIIKITRNEPKIGKNFYYRVVVKD